MYAVTGATGHLGRLVIEALMQKVPAGEIIAVVRSPEKASDLAALGVTVRKGDYDLPETLVAAFAGATKLLLISSSEVGKREGQHKTAIDAAKAAGVKLIAYTSLLHADASALALGVEHRATEKMLSESGVPFVLLRNGWYSENYTGSVPVAVEHGAVLGSAGEGRIASASRADYAAAAVAVLTASDEQAGKIYELAGDQSYSLAEFAAEIAKQAGKPVIYKNLPEAEYKTVLSGFGLPEAFAGIIADSDAKAAAGALFDDSRQLSALIGRPTTPISQSIAQALASA